MILKHWDNSLFIVILITIGFLIYNFFFFPKWEKERKASFLNESFKGEVINEYFDKNRREHRYLIMENGEYLDMKNGYYQNKIKIGEFLEKKRGDSLLYRNKKKYNYLKEYK